MNLNKKIIMLVVGVALVVGGLSFYAGTKYQSRGASRTGLNGMQARGGNTAFGGANRGANRAGMMSNFIMGQVISKDATSITVSGRDGSSKVVFFTQATSVMKMVAGAQNDVVIGQDVTIMGTTNPDGSISANSIQIRPVGTQDQTFKPN